MLHKKLKRSLAILCACVFVSSLVPLVSNVSADYKFPITFENGQLNGFVPFGGAQLDVVDVTRYNGSAGKAVFVGADRQSYGGPSIDVTQYIQPSLTYQFEAYIKSTGAAASQFVMTAMIAQTGQTTQYNWVNNKTISSSDGWVKLSGTQTFTAGQTVVIYIENSDLNSFYMDEFNILLDGKPISSTDTNEPPEPPVTADLPSLKDIYKDYFPIGTTVSPNDLTAAKAAKYAFMQHHFNILTAENDMKPAYLWPNQASGPSFSTADNMVSRVIADGFSMHGHVLVWHSQSPAWLNTGLTYTQAKANLQNYITTVAGHYAQDPVKVVSWDVVNEAMLDNPGNPADWRNALRTASNGGSNWYSSYANGGNGPDYIYDAFLFARAVAPNATLYYNDYNEDNANKATAIAAMVTDINNQYAQEHPEAGGRKLIEGIGMQGHYSTSTSVSAVEASIKKFIAAGVKISVTELDVAINGVASSGPTLDQEKAQAVVYANLFMLYKKYSSSIERVTLWGVDDGESWKASTFPLPFNADLTPKEAYYAIASPESYLGIASATSSSFVNGTMDSGWTIINPVTDGPLAYSLVKGLGLNLKTQPSGMQTDTVSNPVNIFTRPADGDWEAVAKVYYPKAPVHNYQQIAFGVYQDAYNYLKLDIEYNNGYRRVQFSINNNGTYSHTHYTQLNNAAFTAAMDANRLDNLVAYYRIVKSGSVYSASVSFDGINYVTVGTRSGTTGGSATNGQYDVTYANPKLYVSAIKDYVNSSVIDTYCEFVKVMPAASVPASAFQDVVNYVNAETSKFGSVGGQLSLAAGTRYDGLRFTQFPQVPYGYSYRLTPADTNLLVADAETGTVSAQRQGSTTMALELTDGVRTQTLKTINVTVGPGTDPVTVTFNYNYSGAPAAPASFVRQTVGGRLDSFPVEQTFPTVGARMDYGFAGWYPNADGTGEKATLDTVFTQDTSLYAKWEETPSLWKEFADYFPMGAFQDYSYNASPAVGSANYIWNKHYDVMCPSNNFKLTNMIDVTGMRNNFVAARTSILANSALTDEQKHAQIELANEQIVLNANPAVNSQLTALRNWNAAHPDEKKYTRFHVVAWHGGQQPNQFFCNGYTNTMSLTLADEPWTASQDGAIASRDTMKARLDNYIQALMARYKDYSDIILSWDIINEPVDDFTGQIRNNSDSKSQVGQWGQVWHDRNAAKYPDGTVKFTTTADAMGVINNQERLYDESEWIRWAFESAAKWTKANGMNWPLYLNDYMDSNKLYTKLQPTLDVLKWVRNDIDLQGVPLVYGLQGRLSWAYPTIGTLTKQVDDALKITDKVGVTEGDIRSDFEPNPYFNPYDRTRPVTASDVPKWTAGDLNSNSGSTTNPTSSTLTNTFDTWNGPTRRIPEWGTGDGLATSTASPRYGTTGAYLAVSEQIMKNQADFAADWMDILVERANRVQLFQWDGYSDSNTFNSSKGAQLWVNSGTGRTGTFEKYSFYAVIGAPARDKLKKAIEACPALADADKFAGVPAWADYAATLGAANKLLTKRIYTLEGVDDVKGMTAKLLAAAAALESSATLLIYNANGGEGPYYSEKYSPGATAAVRSDVAFYKEGYALVGWNTKYDGSGAAYAAGDPIVMSGNVTLYAQWKANPQEFTVAFDSYTDGTGASLVDPVYPPVQVAARSAVAKPSVNPKKDGYRFLGWYRDMALTKLWDFNAPVTENMRLYAGYSEVPPPQAASITVGGQPLQGFDPMVFNYTLYYEQGQPAAPNVDATAAVSEDEVYAVSISQAGAIPGSATVTITGRDAVSVYTVNFALTPPRLSALELDKAPLAGFDPEKLSYSINCKGAVSVPQITSATAAFSGLNVNIVQASSMPGTATVTVGRNPGDQVVYKIKFTVGPTSDSFVAGTMDGNWTILNPDPNNYSLDKGRGLRLPTLTGDIDGTNRAWNNVFLREVEGNWSVTAKVFFPVSPTRGYQQIALLAWADEDNYIKIECEASSTAAAGATTKVLQFRRELNGTAANLGSTVTATNFHDTDGSLTLYYRLEKTGSNTYTAYYSRDGVTFTQFGTANSTLDNVQYIGLFAVKNQAGAPQIDSYCEYVAFTSLDGETVYTNQQMRQWAADNVRDYVAADIPLVFENDGQITYDLMPRGYTVSAVSSDTAVISNDGAVTRPDSDTVVNYHVTVTDSSSVALTPGSVFTSTADLRILVKGKSAPVTYPVVIFSYDGGVTQATGIIPGKSLGITIEDLVTNTSTQKLIVALYDRTGRLLDIKDLGPGIIEGDVVRFDGKQYDIPANAPAGCYLKAFIWTDATLVPTRAAERLPKL